MKKLIDWLIENKRDFEFKKGAIILREGIFKVTIEDDEDAEKVLRVLQKPDGDSYVN